MSNRSLLEFWFSLSQLSPHAADFTRRQFLRAGGRLAAIAAALLADRFGPMPAAAAEVKLPEITAIPARLKGSGVVRVCSYGGAFQDAQRKAYFEPFERLSGIKVIEAQGPDPAKVKAMVDTKNVEYDVGEFSRGSVLNLLKQGDYWEEIDYELVDTGNIDESFRFKYALDMLPFAQIYAYRTDAFKGAKPGSWADFWDTTKFPGARTMPAGSGGLAPDLEAATLATGVPLDKIYPIDMTRHMPALPRLSWRSSNGGRRARFRRRCLATTKSRWRPPGTAASLQSKRKAYQWRSGGAKAGCVPMHGPFRKVPPIAKTR
jgi:putative spermidine/putrescine transport system substrate-binding protein